MTNISENKCSWCSKPRTKWLMEQAFCDDCAKKFVELHSLFSKIKFTISILTFMAGLLTLYVSCRSIIE